MERKVKYNYAFKLRCVLEVIEKHRSCESVAKEKGTYRSTVRKWVNFYQKFGKDGLHPRKNQHYSVAFKLKVLQTIDKEFLSLSDCCLKFNIPSASVIFQWQKEYLTKGLAGLHSKPRGRPKSMQFKRAKKKSTKPLTREEDLLLENEALRCEVDLLKKLQALTQAKKKHKP
ncbi:MAG: transposase [Flavobacteriaceae bacterium]|nr:transposase [Flavobacteriaceae bacterium]